MSAAGSTFGPGSEPSFADDLRTLASAFTGRWRLIAIITVAFFVMGMAYVWTLNPGYVSSAEIFIDPRERSMVDMEVAPTGLGSSSQGADSALVESQLTILKSRSVLAKLIERENLGSSAALSSDSSDGPLSLVTDLVKRVLYGPSYSSYGSMTPEERIMDRLTRAITVNRVGQTYVLRISVRSSSPEMAARLANSLSEIYLAETQRVGDDSATETAESLEARLTELRAASEASQRAVEDYRRSNGLTSAQGAMVDERELADLTTRVTEAVIASEQARTTLEEIRRSGMGSGAYLDDNVVTQLRVQLEIAQSDESVLGSVYGARHPRLAQARETREALEVALRTELARVQARAQSTYQAAQDVETSLKALLAQYQERRANSDVASVRLRELEQAAAQDLQIYDTFAIRARQAREQIALPTGTARIISVAQPSSQPSEPKATLVLAGSVFVGLVVGSAVAWLMHLLVGPPAPKTRVQQPAPAPARRKSEPKKQDAADWVIANDRPKPSPARAELSEPKLDVASRMHRLNQQVSKIAC